MAGTIRLIIIEGKRILNVRIFLSFLAVVVLFSACSVHSSIRRYEVLRKDGVMITWQENLAHAKADAQDQYIDREILNRMGSTMGGGVYLDETNLEELVMVNYEVRSVRELTDEDISHFYTRRLSNIRAMLEGSQQIRYTQEEIGELMQRGDMRGLVRSATHGKCPLDRARVLTAFIVGIVPYVIGVFLFMVISMAPFGLAGWNQGIQSNRKTFFSLYNITNLQQFLLNTAVGFAALLFVISMILLITVSWIKS